MIDNVFTLSAKAQLEYCACIVKIGVIEPIENSDFLAKTYVNGFPIVVRKDEVKTGDILIYCPIETCINRKFLSVNNLFDLSERKMNINYKNVQKLIDVGDKDTAKSMVGFFNKHGRVKIVTLRGEPSMGFMFKPEDLSKWIKNVDLSGIDELVGTQFDTVMGELFIKVYVPYKKEVAPQNCSNKRLNNRNKRIIKFDRMIEGEFSFHYDTNQLGVNIHRINPDDKIFVDLKFHGTSFCCGNVKVKQPIYMSKAALAVRKRMIHDAYVLGNKAKKIYNNLGIKMRRENILKSLPKTYVERYGNVYSSRGIIKNQYINKNVQNGFYKVDIWGKVNNLISQYIPEGMTVYGEIIGYIPESGKMIQKDYDYGCDERQFKFLIYRITTKSENGTKKEWNKSDVDKWTKQLVSEHSELKPYVQPLVIFYHGKAKDMYPELDPTSPNWNEMFLKRMENDRDLLGLELNEPLCVKQVPREGVVIRIDDDKMAEAFKLKSVAFYMLESKKVDKGEVDVEMNENTNY